MENQQTKNWLLVDTTIDELLQQELQQSFSIQQTPAKHSTLQFYDTFTWQLWFSNRACYQINNQLLLCQPAQLSINDAIAVLNIHNNVPRFWWDMEPSLFKTILKPHLGLRALLPQLKLSCSLQQADIKNHDNKTIVRFEIRSYKHQNKGKTAFLRVCSTIPVRGYINEFKRVNSKLLELGLQTTKTNPLQAYFEAYDCHPRRYSVKPKIVLKARQKARDAIRNLILKALQTARQNEAGIVKDLDTEFLHDFRISIRSIRSMLNQFAQIFPPDIETMLNREFKTIAQRTNRLRDLDVYLLSKKKYQALIPPPFNNGIQIMFDDFRKERAREQTKISRYLQSKSYLALMGKLEKTIEDSNQFAEQINTNKSALNLAEEKLNKQYKKVRKLIRQIEPSTPDAAIHRLRIQCKKLRYLLEFFASLFPANKIQPIIKRLRGLQNTLGTFNDLSVQQQSVLDYYHDFQPKHSNELTLGLAIGALVGVLHEHQLQSRAKIFKQFTEFDSPTTSKLFKSLLKSNRGRD